MTRRSQPAVETVRCPAALARPCEHHALCWSVDHSTAAAGGMQPHGASA